MFLLREYPCDRRECSHRMAWYTGTCAHLRVQAYGPAGEGSIRYCRKVQVLYLSCVKITRSRAWQWSQFSCSCLPLLRHQSHRCSHHLYVSNIKQSARVYHIRLYNLFECSINSLCTYEPSSWHSQHPSQHPTAMATSNKTNTVKPFSPRNPLP